MSARIPVNSLGTRFSGSSVSHYNTKELDLNHTDTTDDSLTGNLNLNRNRIILIIIKNNQYMKVQII